MLWREAKVPWVSRCCFCNDESQNYGISSEKLVDPVKDRYKDEEARAQASGDLLKCIVDYRMSTEYLPNEDRDLIMSECNKAEKWLREKTQEQDSLPKNIDPLIWSSEIKSRTEDLDMECKHIMTRKASHKM